MRRVKNRLSFPTILIVFLFVVGICACNPQNNVSGVNRDFSQARFSDLEQAVTYFYPNGDIMLTMDGTDTCFVAFEASATRGGLVFEMQQGEYTISPFKTSIIELSGARDESLIVYSAENSEDRYFSVELWNLEGTHNMLTIENDYGWTFKRVTYSEPNVFQSIAYFTAAPGEYSITVNGEKIPFTLE